MRKPVRFHHLGWLPLLAAMLAASGCNSSSGVPSEEPLADYSKVRTMTGFYDGYLAKHRGQAPPNEQAFREYLNTNQENLQKAGMTVDQMFISPRGDKPLKWSYGRKPPVWRQNGMTCYAYETVPVAGKRLMIGGRGMVQEVDEAQFKSIFPQG